MTFLGQFFNRSGQHNLKITSALAGGAFLLALSAFSAARERISQANQAQETLAIAKAETQIEQQETAVIRQFETDQSEALVSALEAGQELQALVKRRAKAKDAVFVHQKLALI